MQEKNRVGLSSNAHTVNTSQTNLNASWVPFINRGIAEFETSERLEQLVLVGKCSETWEGS